MTTEDQIPDGELAHKLVALSVGDTVHFEFEWDGVVHTKTTTVVSHQLRESEIRPDDAPEPSDVDLETEAGVQYRFTVITSGGEPVPIGAPGTFERKAAGDERFTQLPEATVLSFEVDDQ